MYTIFKTFYLHEFFDLIVLFNVWLQQTR